MTEAPGNYAQIPVDKIVPSPYQHRKTFGGTEDAELADSVRVHGVLQPVRVRPNGKVGHFELVFGERRWRAAKTAKLDLIPAIVVDLTDDQAIEQLLLENLQRRDVHPIEEGEGYHELLHKHGYTIEQLIAKTGRSKAHLYGRIKLARELAPAARKAVLDGKLPIAHAELIARIGDVKMQEQCTREVLGQLGDEDRNHKTIRELQRIGIDHERVAVDEENAYDGKRQPLSYDATRALIRRRYMTKLALATFNPADATLTSAGACTSCQHRSGNQPELPGVASPKGDDLCTKPSCYEEKTKASWKKAAENAKERGLEVVPAKEAKKVFAYDGVSVAGDSPYVNLTDELPYNLQKSPGSKATWGKLLGKQATEVPRVLVQDQSGAPRELLDKSAAVKLLREQGKIEKSEPKKSSSPNYEEQQKRDQKRRELAESAVTRTLELMFTLTPKKEKELALWRWIARRALHDVYDLDLIVEKHKLKNDHEIPDLADKMKTLDEVRGLLLDCFATEVGMQACRTYANKEDKEDWAQLCKLLGVDHEKSVEAAKAAAKAEAKADDAKAPAKAKKAKAK